MTIDKQDAATVAAEMNDEDAVWFHQVLAAYHAKLARTSILDIIHEYHEDMAERLQNEVVRIPERAEAHARVAARAGSPC